MQMCVYICIYVCMQVYTAYIEPTGTINSTVVGFYTEPAITLYLSTRTAELSILRSQPEPSHRSQPEPKALLRAF